MTRTAAMANRFSTLRVPSRGQAKGRGAEAPRPQCPLGGNLSRL